jgi:hypothetical protein
VKKTTATCPVAGCSHATSTSLPFFERSGSVHAARLKQQGRRLPDRSFEMPTSTRRRRASGFFVALIQRTHPHRAMGVMSCQSSDSSGAVAAARLSLLIGTSSGRAWINLSPKPVPRSSAQQLPSGSAVFAGVLLSPAAPHHPRPLSVKKGRVSTCFVGAWLGQGGRCGQ